MQYSTIYITLKWKLQIEKIEDPAIWTKLVILKKFLSLANKHDFIWKLFSNLLICQQPPKQLETWNGLDHKNWVANIKKNVKC